MAFTDAEKGKILFFLGYSVFEDNGPAMRSLNSIDSVEPVAGPIVRDLLCKLEDIVREVHETMPLAAAIEDGSVKVRAHYTLDHLWRLGRSYVNQLARFLKISIDGDVFSSSSNVRDNGSFYSGDPAESRFGR
jgi:hypothetical protein